MDDDEEEEEEDVADDIVDVDLVEEKSRSIDNGYHQESLFSPREAMTAPAGFGYQVRIFLVLILVTFVFGDNFLHLLF